MRTWAEFYDYCHADVPGVLSIAAERELRRAAQEFMEKTKVWKVDLDPIYVFSGVNLYDIDVPKGTTIVKILSAKHDSGTAIDLEPSGGNGLSFINQLQFSFPYMPTGDYRIHFRAVLTPNHEAKGIEDALFQQYAEDIAHGAKARLYLQPQKTYTDKSLAGIEREKFDAAIWREQVKAAKGFSGAPLRTRPNNF